MSFAWTYLYDQFVVFTLVTARVGALVMTAPILNSSAIPRHIRAFLVIAISLIVTTFHLGTRPDIGENLLSYGWTMSGEILIGLLLGLGVSILFSGIQLAGQFISQLSGMAFAEIVSPGSDNSSPVVTNLLHFVTMAVFVLIGGHREMMEALLDTYTWAPPGQGIIAGSYLDALVSALTQSFVMGIRAAAPAMAALLLSTLVLGLIGRTMPQINILAVGFGINTLLMLGCVMLSIGTLAFTFQDETSNTLERLKESVYNAADMTNGTEQN